MNALPADHPQRLALAEEVHARPPQALGAPARVSHLAVLVEPSQRAAEREHLAQLCRLLGQPLPTSDAGQVLLGHDALQLKWERHGEFSGYTVIAEGAGDQAQPFAEAASARLPAGWLAAVPGRTLVAAHVLLWPAEAPESADSPRLRECFGPGAVVVGSRVAGGAGSVYTDFRVHADGCSRFVLLDHGFTPRQAGRALQRVLEVEVYRMLALLALPLAQQLAADLLPIEAELARLTSAMARDEDPARDGAAAVGREELLLQELTRLAAEVERGLSGSQFRFGACAAYSRLVATRIEELREARLPGLQTLGEFMARRFSPAVATCASVSQRLRELSERVARASSLLATRVGIARERQNQALLASMNRRARMQLRLQQTVEGLSVAAIAYYASGLAGYLLKGAKAAGLPIDLDLTVGLLVPLLVVAVYFAVHRARSGLREDDEGA